MVMTGNVTNQYRAPYPSPLREALDSFDSTERSVWDELVVYDEQPVSLDGFDYHDKPPRPYGFDIDLGHFRRCAQDASFMRIVGTAMRLRYQNILNTDSNPHPELLAKMLGIEMKYSEVRGTTPQASFMASPYDTPLMTLYTRTIENECRENGILAHCRVITEFIMGHEIGHYLMHESNSPPDPSVEYAADQFSLGLNAIRKLPISQRRAIGSITRSYWVHLKNKENEND